MAIVIGPLHSSEARGSVGSLTYNTFRGTATVRARYTPAIEKSVEQNKVTAATAACTLVWQAESDLTRSRWSHYANMHLLPSWTGHPKRLSGYNWYVKCNYWGYFLGWYHVHQPPTVPSPPAIDQLIIPNNAGNLHITWTPDPSDPPKEYSNLIYKNGPHLPSVNPGISNASYEYIEADSSGEYWYPDPGVGTMTFWLKRLDRATGLLSLWQRASAIRTP